MIYSITTTDNYKECMFTHMYIPAALYIHDFHNHRSYISCQLRILCIILDKVMLRALILLRQHRSTLKATP